VVIHPGSGGSSPNWPIERYRELAALIKTNPDHEVVITGHESDIPGFEGCIDLGGKTDLETLAGVIYRASVFISGSTGPLHLADALGVKCLSFYLNRPDIGPRRWGPRRNMKNIVIPSDECCCPDLTKCRCLERVSPGEVLIRLKCVLNEAVIAGAKKN
jgi:ADP-heptose:LPS heptosyltransferase